MAIIENYLTFIDICKKDGVYADKKCALIFRVRNGQLHSKGRDGKFDLHFGNVNIPNKKRFLKYSEKQAKRL